MSKQMLELAAAEVHQPSNLLSLLDNNNGARAEWIRKHLDYPDKDWCLIWPFGSEQLKGRSPSIGGEIAKELSKATMAYADRGRGPAGKQAAAPMGHGDSVGSDGGDVSDADGSGLPLAWSQSHGENGQQGWRVPSAGDWWAVEPDVGRVAHGIPGRVDRLRQLGNSVVPQIPEIIGRAIMTSLTSQLRSQGE